MTRDDSLALQMRAESDFNLVRLNAAPAYLLCIFLGVFGAHRFYLRRPGSAVAILVIYVLSWPLMFLLVGFVTIWIPAIWVFVDLFLIGGILQQANSATRSQIYQHYGLAPAPIPVPGYAYPPQQQMLPAPAMPAPALPAPAPALPAPALPAVAQPAAPPSWPSGPGSSM